jgi:hypothetical protein
MDSDALSRIIAARVPELSEADLADVHAKITGDTVPMSTLENVLTMLDGIERRLAEIESGSFWFGPIGHA